MTPAIVRRDLTRAGLRALVAEELLLARGSPTE